MDAEHIRVAVGALKKTFSDDPEKAVATDSFARARLTNGLAIAVEGPSGQKIASDMPIAFGGSGASPSPGWYVRAGIASCTATVIALRAAELSVPLQHLEVKVESRSNDSVMVGVADDVPAGPLEAAMSVDIRSDGTSREALQEIVAWGIAHSPMADALRRAVPLNVAVTIG